MNGPAAGQARYQPGPAPSGVVGGLTEFGNDVFTLAELQARLALLDTKECVGRATVPVVALVIASTLALGTIPVVLLGVADLLARALAIRAGWAMLMVSAASLVVAGLTAAIFTGRLTASLESFRRSAEEFSRNLSWIRTVVLHSGRAAPSRGR